MTKSQEDRLRELIRDAIGHKDFCDVKEHDIGKHIDEIVEYAYTLDPLDFD